jgi:NAD(P)-dependent dehydrogenase (short-subunit alcohol dehydrogenase family)
LVSLKDKKVLVTGASSDIGRTISIAISIEESQLWITGRDIGKLRNTKRACKNSERVNIVTTDLVKLQDINSLISCLPILDGIILNAGLIKYIPIKLVSEEKINQIFGVNFNANVLLIQQLLKQRKIAGGASIVFISSVSAHLGVPGTSLYAASKAALTAFAKVLAGELASKKIRANIISPGIVRTSAIGDNNQLSSKRVDEEEVKYPLGYGIPTDIAGLAIYLLSDSARWITGSDFIIDGGYTLQ